MRGYVRKYKNSWAGVVELGKDPGTGKRLQKWVYASTQEECQRKLNKLMYELDEGIYISPSRMTLAAYLRDWIEMHAPNIAPNTVDGYKCTIEKHIIPMLGNILLVELTPMHLQKLYASEQKKYSGRTAQLTHRILRKALSTAYKMQVIRKNPADMVDPPKAKKYRPAVYDEQEYESLVEAAAGTEHEIPIALAGGLGLRRGEILGLKWSDINFKKNIVTIQRQLIPTSEGLLLKEPKTEDSIRTLDTPQHVMDMLRRHLKNQEKNKLFFGSDYKDDNLVCCKPDGEPIHPSSYSRDFGKLLKMNDLRHIRFHDLRHFNATIMLQCDIPVKVASKRLGHSTTAITQDTYQHVLLDMDKEAARKIDEVLFKKAKK